ncbi:PREDICTED: uncharacterized protein LOC108362439 [Rhagoletis zephyria]|uniref:uncharacterized protein LOC108362439 n=1 Tax=Rhagoletis zephyria TaxID=28612 RepID=UPI000811A5B3|nr:PREDICTED: uncharacterized protein LOC108362439 [Rhagoletis zephyria]
MPEKLVKALDAVLGTQKLSIDLISNTFDAKFKDLSKQFDAIKDLIISLHSTNNNSSANNLNAVNADMMAAEFNARKTAANISYHNNYYFSSPGVLEFSTVSHAFNSPRAQFVSNVNGISPAHLDSAVTIATAVNTLVTNDSTYTSITAPTSLSSVALQSTPAVSLSTASTRPSCSSFADAVLLPNTNTNINTNTCSHGSNTVRQVGVLMDANTVADCTVNLPAVTTTTTKPSSPCTANAVVAANTSLPGMSYAAAAAAGTNSVQSNGNRSVRSPAGAVAEINTDDSYNSITNYAAAADTFSVQSNVNHASSPIPLSTNSAARDIACANPNANTLTALGCANMRLPINTAASPSTRINDLNDIGANVPRNNNAKKVNDLRVFGSSTNADLKVAEHLKWLHLASFMPSEKHSGISKNLLSCFKLVKKDAATESLKHVNFKLGVPEGLFRKLLMPEIWPANVTVRPFRFLQRKEKQSQPA